MIGRITLMSGAAALSLAACATAPAVVADPAPQVAAAAPASPPPPPPPAAPAGPPQRVQDLGGGIYMLIGNGGNIGLSVGPDGAFVIDDQFPNNADQNLAKIRELAGGGPKFVVNTHWHGDHAGGNAAFAGAGATIFAHENVRKRISGQVATPALGGSGNAPASPPEAWPVVTFTQGVDFHLNGETINVYKVQASHTDGDSFVHFREPDILHMGDVFFNGRFPVIDIGSGGSVKGFLAAQKDALTRVSATTRIIPGHGELATRADLEKSIAMLEGAIAAVQARIDAGDTLEQAVARKPLAPWSSWAWNFINEDRFTTIVYTGLKAGT
ncbi:MBL fold metallo-hydrolase [bacterium]|nr:MBL fold metallo-hydrolase [bacterium]